MNEDELKELREFFHDCVSKSLTELITQDPTGEWEWKDPIIVLTE